MPFEGPVDFAIRGAKGGYHCASRLPRETPADRHVHEKGGALGLDDDAQFEDGVPNYREYHFTSR